MKRFGLSLALGALCLSSCSGTGDDIVAPAKQDGSPAAAKPSGQAYLLGSYGLSIYALNISNGWCTELVGPRPDPEAARNMCPAFDPGSKTLFYVDCARKAVMAWPSGGKAEALYELDSQNCHQIPWLLLSPDGGTLYFMFDDSARPGALLAYDRASRKVRKIAAGEVNELQCPAWLDDSHLLVATTTRPREGYWQLGILDLRTTEVQKLALEAYCGWFALSESRNRICVGIDYGSYGIYENPSLKPIREIKNSELPGKYTEQGVWFVGDRYIAMYRVHADTCPFFFGNTYLVDVESKTVSSRKLTSMRLDEAHVTRGFEWAPKR